MVVPTKNLTKVPTWRGCRTGLLRCLSGSGSLRTTERTRWSVEPQGLAKHCCSVTLSMLSSHRRGHRLLLGGLLLGRRLLLGSGLLLGGGLLGGGLLLGRGLLGGGLLGGGLLLGRGLLGCRLLGGGLLGGLGGLLGRGLLGRGLLGDGLLHGGLLRRGFLWCCLCHLDVPM